MRLLIITQRWYPDTFGGSEYVAAQQARRLAKRGHQVTVLTERVKEDLPERTAGQNFCVYRYGSAQQLARWGGRSRTDIQEVPRLLREITKLRKFEVAILHHPFSAYGFFKLGLKIPTLYIFHASTAKEAAYEGTRLALLTPWFVAWAKRVERTVLKRAERIAVLSEFSRQVVAELAPEVKDKVVPLKVGVEIAKGHSTIRVSGRMAKEGGPELLTVRRLTPRMGLLELLRAMASVVKQLPGAQLTIVGEGPLRQALEHTIAQLGLQPVVTLTGRVAEEQLPRYYQKADLFVLPSQAYEGLGIAMLQALSYGVPVVGTPVGAIPEVLNQLDAQLLTKSAHPEDLAQGILDYFTRSPQEREQLAKSAQQLAQSQYAWEPAILNLEQLLQELCGFCK